MTSTFFRDSVVGVISPSGHETSPSKAAEESVLAQLAAPSNPAMPLSWCNLS
ncbi:hypothetical protein F5Y19DRAFT_425220 [Xylariaceae sp. FL1651]|nr:hypothetical protein F5Y19DRAFT_425220 [Xylariaceae sp. FL1651]